MVDGKVCNALASISSAQRCYLCKATSKDFNDIDMIFKKPVSADNFQYGLSSLHAWIRCFECCLHLSYKLETKKWQARKVDDKKAAETRKKAIQEAFKRELGLLVDIPKQGTGSSNDGNTARRFFENSAVSSMITGVDQNLINRFHVVLQAITSGHDINVDKFRDYAIETARLFVKLYPWYYMPTSIHKLLIHGPEIIASALLPIGQLSEDAQESSNKLIRKYRRDFSRKSSRTKTMTDVFLRLMASSDPFISSLREVPQKKIKALSEEAVALLHIPNDSAISESEDSDATFGDDNSSSSDDSM